MDPLILSKVRVHWLKVDVPEDTDESPESQARGESARKELERLVRESGGTMIDVDTTSDLSAISGAALGAGGSRCRRLNMTTATVAAAIVCLAAWTLAGILSMPALLEFAA